MRRTPPMFPPTIWNVHDATVNGDSRTNNVGYAHPSIWRVVEWCQKEEATVRTLIQQDAVGTPPVKRVQQRYVQLQLRLQNLCRDLTSGNKTIAEFLRGVDDTVLFDGTAQDLQTHLNAFHDYCKAWNLKGKLTKLKS
ncbi:Hypothetical predicted protein [Mytilus galloprovincialis]|uniref:Uncharacterized protein n=1 Tax=Mytilus galloprovincialis TaxID=29158 RepID=A0A8B6CTH5_MYTGA|nr:Hypothetical predicted protein [Mytilus galloprovincialis]